jgi:hypothetical protein
MNWLVWATACGGDGGTPPVVPASLAIAGGDAQLAPFGDTLPQPLAVIVTGSDNRPFSGATVAWTAAPAGAASFLSPTSTSGSDGRASTVVVLGSIAGAVSVTATVTGVTTPGTFGLQAVDPCDFLRPHTLGGTSTGVLATRDCPLGDGSYIDFYSTTNPVAQWLLISMTSSAFDAFLFLNDPTGPLLAFSDDDNTSTNSAIRILVASGSYVIGANSFSPGQTGQYTISSAITSSNVTNCVDVWLSRGVQTNQQIEATDCNRNGFFIDGYFLVLQAGQSVTITQSSTAVDAYLELLDLTGTVVAFDDDSGGGSDARITYTSTVAAIYVVGAETFTIGETGAYTLSVSAGPLIATTGVATIAGPTLRDLAVKVKAPTLSSEWWAAASRTRGSSRPAKPQP